MAYVITDACVKDFLCVEECSMDAIAPKAGDPKAGEVSQVFINPQECADCGACIAVCEHDAIFSEDSLPADKADAAAKNAEFFQ
jgi:ferredoxin